jgi:hypothetical protein
MNRTPDVELVLREYFADDGASAPDHVLDVIEDRISRQPQRRAWPFSRRTTMSNQVKVIAGLAAALVVAVVGYTLLTRSSSEVGEPAPATTPSPTPAESPLALPAAPLEARDYVGRAFPGDSMAFIITAPKGWMSTGEFFMSSPNGSGPPAGIGISFNHDPEVVTDPCDSSEHTPPPGSRSPTIEDLVAAISAREDLRVTGVTDTELGGYSGRRLDIQLPAELACSRHYVFAEPKGLYANGPSNRWRVWFLDVEGSTAVVVLLDHAGTPREDRAAAQAAIDSIRITP